MITPFYDQNFGFTMTPTGGVPTAISYGLRVVVTIANGAESAVVADNTVIGRGICGQDTPAGASNIFLISRTPGTRPAVVTGCPVTYGNTLYAAAGGLVAPTGTVIVGVAFTTINTNGAAIEYEASGGQ